MALALHVNHTSLVILELAVMLLSAFLLSRLTKRLKLPNVTAYIVAGILIGPCGLKWIDAEMVESMASSPTWRFPSSPLAWGATSSGKR